MSERKPLFEPGDPRRFYTINTDGPLTSHYWGQLTKEMDIHSSPQSSEVTIVEDETPSAGESNPIEVILVDMSTTGETGHTTNLISPLEPKLLP